MFPVTSADFKKIPEFPVFSKFHVCEILCDLTRYFSYHENLHTDIPGITPGHQPKKSSALKC